MKAEDIAQSTLHEDVNNTQNLGRKESIASKAHSD